MRRLIGLFFAIPILAAGLRAQSTLLVPSQFPTIQTAISAAMNGDTILVDPGTYAERISTVGKAISIISSQGPEVTTIDAGFGGPGISFISGETAQTLIEGFRVVNGVGFPISVINNQVIRAGGGIYVFTSSPTVRNCIVENNQANRGGGVDVTGSAFFDRCVIRGNTAFNKGGGISFMPGGLPVFENCDISSNLASNAGGGVSVEGSASGFLVNCMITDNTVPGVFYRTAPKWGGGVFLQNGAALTVAFSTIAGNFASHGGAFGSDGNIIGLVIRNSIIWHNAGFAIQSASGGASVEYTAIEGGHVGVGNINVDPNFVDPSVGDYHLALGSPCINAATAATFFIASTDIDQEVRQIYGAPDMGCDEVIDIGASAAMAGNAGVTLGTPQNVLLVNGSHGGLDRRVKAVLGESNTVTMLQPQNVALPTDFAIFGLIGTPTEADQVTLPMGIGDMAFTPHVLIPFAYPQVFTFTDSAGSIRSAAVTSTPTPWTSAPQAGIPFPLTLSFQGIVEEAPGVLRATNCVILVVD